MNQFMNTAVLLAESVYGQTGKNPPVGAVIVKSGRIIGMGAHLEYGGNHAEVNAVNNCFESPRGADMYISLEPCSHYGQTPPCTEAIIQAGIRHVYYAVSDSTLDGFSEAVLSEAGIGYTHMPVTSGTSDALYRPFVISKTHSRPFITLKCAMSLDGKITSNSAGPFVSNDTSRQDVQTLRHKHDGILVGRGTLEQDNPALTTRLENGRQIKPVVLLGRGTLNSDMAVLKHPERPVVFTQNKDNVKFRDVCDIHLGQFSMEEILKILYNNGISSLLIEGGSHILSECIHNQLFDDLIIYIAPKIFGYSEYPLYHGPDENMDPLKLQLHDVEKLDSDIKLTYRRTASCLQD